MRVRAQGSFTLFTPCMSEVRPHPPINRLLHAYLPSVPEFPGLPWICPGVPGRLQIVPDLCSIQFHSYAYGRPLHTLIVGAACYEGCGLCNRFHLRMRTVLMGNLAQAGYCLCMICDCRLCCVDLASLVSASLLVVHAASHALLIAITVAAILAGITLVAFFAVTTQYDCCSWNSKWTDLSC